MIAPVLILLAAIVVGGLLLFQQQQKAKRRRALYALAAELGFQCWDDDPFGTLTLPFGLFEKGDGRGVDLLMAGTANDVPVRMLDYWYYDQSSDGNGRQSRTYHRFTCSVSVLDGIACPRISVKREGLLSKIGQHLGFTDIDFESEEFNRLFQVHSEDKKFAYAIIDAAMIDFMLKTGGLCGYEAVGPYLLVTMDKLSPPDWRALLHATFGFHANVPHVVRDMYPGAGPLRSGWS